MFSSLLPFLYRILVFTFRILKGSFLELDVPGQAGTFSRCSARLLPIYRVRHARISPRSNQEPVIVPLISRLTPRNRNSFRGQALSIAFIVAETVTARHVPPFANRVRCTLRCIQIRSLRYRIFENLGKLSLLLC